MADSISIEIETKEVEAMLTRLLKKVERPAVLLKNIERLVHALTMKMFRGRRPDTAPVRGVKWPKLKESTLKAKRAKVKRGKSIVAARPMVDTGKTRDTLKVLNRDSKGFTYGTRTKSNRGYPYPGHWNKSKFPFLFFTKTDFAQLSRMTVDYLDGVMKSFKNYMRT